jgi:fatty acid/phospholipid biosynthesis enzyme
MFISSDDLCFSPDHLTIGLVRPNVSLVGFIEGDVNITGSVRDIIRVLRNFAGSVNLRRRQQVQRMINRILRHHSHSNF